MKRFFIALILFVSILSLSITVSAHPGKTDSNGGHFDHSTGEYHYHHGYEAHSHYDVDHDDIIDCPYDFDDQTGVNSGFSWNNSGYDYSPNETITVYKDREVTREIPVTPQWVKLALGALLFLLFIFFIIAKVKVNNLTKDLNNQSSLRDCSEKENKEILKCFNVDAVNTYGNSYLYRICGAPHGDYICIDNLPAAYYGRDQEWGEKYTFYLAIGRFNSTNKFHRCSCKCAKSAKPINAYTLNRLPNSYEPCPICNPVIPDMTWVDKYLKYKKFFEKYCVEIPKMDIEKEIGRDPYIGFVTQEMLEDKALDLGVSLQTALLIINQKRRLYGIPELNIEQYQT